MWFILRRIKKKKPSTWQSTFNIIWRLVVIYINLFYLWQIKLKWLPVIPDKALEGGWVQSLISSDTWSHGLKFFCINHCIDTIKIFWPPYFDLKQYNGCRLTEKKCFQILQCQDFTPISPETSQSSILQTLFNQAVHTSKAKTVWSIRSTTDVLSKTSELPRFLLQVHA